MPKHSLTDDVARNVSDMAVTDELARLLFKHSPLVFAPSALVAGFVLVILLPHVDTGLLMVWMIAVAAIVVLRFYIVIGYWRTDPPAGGSIRWARIYTAATFVAGLIWGLLPVFFLAIDPPEVFLGISMALVGIAAGSMGLYTSWLPAYIAFTTPVLFLLSASIMRHEGELLLLAIMGLIAYVTFLVLALFAHSRLRSGVRAQLGNLALAERLDAEKARAEKESEAKSELLAGISHDLRQPLQSIHLYTDLLRQQSVSQTADDVTDKIHHSLWGMTCMVNQLIDMSRMEAGAIEVNMRSVDLEPVAERLYAQFMLRADHKGIDLEVDCPSLYAWSDPVLLGRVLDNLVANALRYTEEGDVCVVFSANGNNIEIDVLDSGPGIPPEQQDRIFNAFYQIDEQSHQSNDGIGLGLAIVKRLCTLMDVGLQIMSTESGGTWVKLRLQSTSSSDRRAPNGIEPLAGDLLQGFHVMVVENEAVVRAAIENALGDHGCSIAGFSTPQSALSAFGSLSSRPIIVTGVSLVSECDGIEMVRLMRAQAKHELPVVLVLSGTNPSVETDLRESCEFVRKPLDDQSILGSVARAIDRAAA